MKPNPILDSRNIDNNQELVCKIIKRIDILTEQNQLNAIETDPKLKDAALLLKAKNKNVTFIRNGRIFIVCSYCGGYCIIHC